MLLRTDTAGPVSPAVRRLAEAMRARPEEVTVRPLTLRDRAVWDAYVCRHPEGSFFHTTAWLDSVREVFGHAPHSLGAWRGTVLVGVLPLVGIRSRFGGRMLVSVPYAVEGGPLADDEAALRLLWNAARQIGREVGAGVIDLRSRTASVSDLEPVEGYVSFRRDLPATAGEVLKWLPRKARAAARNARNKHGLAAQFGKHHLPEVWRLYARSMRRLGSISYPQAFFEALVERGGRNAYVQIVEWEERVVAGLVSFRFGATFLPYFVGCDERFKHLSVNNFVYLAAMERAVEAGCRVFDFGRSRADNRGACDFKRFHGFSPSPLGYQRYVYPGAAAPNLTPGNPRFQLARRCWPHLPVAVTMRLGAWASRHIPG